MNRMRKYKVPSTAPLLSPTSETSLLGRIILITDNFLDLLKTQSKISGQIKLTGNRQGDMRTAIAYWLERSVE